jgi:hypothetical protein
MNPIASATALALLFLPSHATPHAQEEHPLDPRIVKQAEIVLEQYRVQHVDPVELYGIARELVGRSYFVEEHGGFQSDELANLRLLGDTLVVYDTAQHAQRAKELFARLDTARDAEAALESREYTPRFVSLETVRAAAGGLVDVSRLPERALAVLRGTPANVAQALALLQRIDQPDPQVFLTCQLVEVTETAEGPALPAELLENLQELLPGTAFTQVGMAMLKTSVGGGAEIALELESTGKRYRFSFVPAAYDATSGALTATSCSLLQLYDDGSMRELFRTDAVLRGGEYTVLAATGATPRLLVIRVTPGG